MYNDKTQYANVFIIQLTIDEMILSSYFKNK